MAYSDHTQRTTTIDLRHVGPLIAGDLLAFLVFALIGMSSHSEGITPLKLLEVASPFALGWFVVAPWLGVFTPAVAGAPRRIAGRAALAWLLALPIGLGLRALLIGRGSPLSFAIVTFITLLVLLLGWREAYAWRVSRKIR